MPPPPPPADVYSNDDWGDTAPTSNYANAPQVGFYFCFFFCVIFCKFLSQPKSALTVSYNSPFIPLQSYDAGDDWDDEWDDDSESGSKPAGGLQGLPGSFSHVPKSGSAGDMSSIGKRYCSMSYEGKAKLFNVPILTALLVFLQVVLAKAKEQLGKKISTDFQHLLSQVEKATF